MITFNWLHLTDLHLGMAEQDSLFPAIKDRFFEDIARVHDRCGPWDLVLFTGDLTQKGGEGEFKRVDEFLNELWERLKALGSESPGLLTVPGNHDLVRPNPKAPAVKLLKSWRDDVEVRTDFWNDPNSAYRHVVTEAFTNYVRWREGSNLKAETTSGLLPGDFSAVIEKSGESLGIVGLNTTFLQLTDGDYREKLAVSALQFNTACGGDGPAWVKRQSACLLLTHQPPSWLCPESRNQLVAEIVGNEYFTVHLFGHMHEGRYESTSVGGAAPLRTFQASSLFGLEYFGENRQQQDRRHGYNCGRIELGGDAGTLLHWPREANRPGGQWNFSADNKDFVLTNEHTSETFPLRRVELLRSPLLLPLVTGAIDAGSTSEKGPFPNRWAVVVGINDYTHFTKLNYCRQDAAEFATVLRGTLKFNQVYEIHEESEAKPDREHILTTLVDLRESRKVKPEDLFVFYFSGHGINESGRDYLLPMEARPRAVKTLGIMVADLAESLTSFECKNTVIFLDACRDAIEGAKGSQAIGENSSEVLKQAGIVAFFSCGPKDRSWEIEELRHSSFTSCILDAIREGDASTASELDTYLRESVPQVNLKYKKPSQLPYAVIFPPDRGDLPILYNPLLSKRTAEKYAYLIDGLTERVAVGRLDQELFVSVVSFIAQVQNKRKLDAVDNSKLSAIKSFVEGKWPADIFRNVWRNLESVRTRAPEIKKPELLS